MSVKVLEIAQGERFQFGENWKHFLSTLNETRIEEAEKSLKKMLQVENLTNKSFLDVGSGSGIFSLAAKRLGARVHSFDYDLESVACTMELRRRYFSDDSDWTVEEGSVLDTNYLHSLGKFDVVYSWGVLHHTGQMWQALENVSELVSRDGQLFIAIYDDGGWRSTMWRRIKKTYNRLPQPLKTPFVFLLLVPGQSKALLQSILTRRLNEYIRSWTQYSKNRGMSRWHDAVDWIGGYPYEVATAGQLTDFFKAKGFDVLQVKRPDYKLGCNELVFARHK
ncbi:MAG TPA: class I SAM-dependent methyltransferase [Pyrinomonadaceae bacterium]|nr:class I SAM-dependent methyltransferase [Pyrinomonadaceae bacterium]